MILENMQHKFNYSILHYFMPKFHSTRINACLVLCNWALVLCNCKLGNAPHEICSMSYCILWSARLDVDAIRMYTDYKEKYNSYINLWIHRFIEGTSQKLYLLSFSKVTYLTLWSDGIIFDIFITTAEYDTLYDKKVSGNTVWNPFFTSQWWQHGYSISDSRNFLYHSNIFNVTTNTIDALITGEIHVDTEWIEKNWKQT